MPMVESGLQPYFLGAQHTVTEYISPHITDADYRYRLPLNIDPHLAKVSLHTDPGSASGYT